MEYMDVVKALAALAQTSRLRAFRALVIAGDAGLTPGDLAPAMAVPANTLSFHLKELVHADLVSQERAGRRLIYRVRFDRMDALLAFLTQNCCQGQPCLPSTGDGRPSALILDQAAPRDATQAPTPATVKATPARTRARPTASTPPTRKRASRDH